MSYIGNTSDVEQEKNLSEYRRQRSSSNLMPSGAKQTVGSPKMSDVLWNDKRAASRAVNASDDDDSEVSDSENFLAKGAFLLTPSHELSMDRAALICEKMNFKGCFSLTKTATGILFKFSNPEDYQAVFKKGFHKVTGARFYKKIAIPCRPQKTFMLYVFDVPEDLPEEDIRHSLYRFNSVVEVVRLVVQYQKPAIQPDPGQMHATGKWPPTLHPSRAEPLIRYLSFSFSVSSLFVLFFQQIFVLHPFPHNPPSRCTGCCRS